MEKNQDRGLGSNGREWLFYIGWLGKASERRWRWNRDRNKVMDTVV